MQVDVIKKFIQPALHYTENHMPDPIPFLDMLIINATDGIYQTYFEAVDDFISLYNSYQDKLQFLLVECGIDFTNDDSGSIIGTDAGGLYTIPYSFVTEVGEIQIAPSEFTIQGLTFHCPSGMSSNEQWICDALYTWWAEDILVKIKKYFGISFTSSSYVTDIEIVFVEPSVFSAGQIVGAVVNTSFYVSTGKPFKLVLEIPRAWANYIDKVDDIGKYPEYDIWLDSILAHEFVHAVISANTYWYPEMPDIFVEGVAEVFCGSDTRQPTYLSELSSGVNKLKTDLVGNSVTTPDAYVAASTFLRWLAKKFNINNSSNDGLSEVGTPFLNKFIYWLIYYDKKNGNASQVIDSALAYATDHNKNPAQSLTQFLNYYTDKYNNASGNIEDKLYDIAKIQFNNLDCGCYGGSDSLVSDIDIPRIVRIYYEGPYESTLGRNEVLTYSNKYFMPYDKDTYECSGLIIYLPTYTPTTVNVYYKKRVISRLVAHVFKYALNIIKTTIRLDFQNTSYNNKLYITFDDTINPVKPMSYYVTFESSGIVQDFHIIIYIHAFIPEDNSDGFPTKDMYATNIILYIFIIFVLLSKLRHASAYYKNPFIIAIAVLLTGYDELGEADIKNVNETGRIPSVMGGDIDG